MPPANTPSAQPPELLDQVRERIRTKHCSIRTEAQYVQWVSRLLKNVARGSDGMRTERNEAAFDFFVTAEQMVGCLSRPPSPATNHHGYDLSADMKLS
jgi:hypothetical protein